MAKSSEKIPGRVTQRDIAKAVGVSHVAVSHVLHRPHQARISPETQREILRMAQSMGYEPRGATTHSVTIVVQPDSLWTDGVSSILIAADDVLKTNGYRMTVSTLDADSMHTAPRLFNQKTTDAVIFTEWYGRQSECLHSLRVPWLLLADPDDLDSRVDQIAFDTAGASRQLAEYLLTKGHERIVVVTGVAGVGFHERHVRGAREALQLAGLPPENLTVIYDSVGKQIHEQLVPHLRSKNASTGIIAGSPGAAMVILNRLHVNGFRVPEDISMVALFDSPRLTALEPKITATTSLGHEDARLAVERLVQKIKNPGLEPQRVFTAGQIIERESVAIRGVGGSASGNPVFG